MLLDLTRQLQYSKSGVKPKVFSPQHKRVTKYSSFNTALPLYFLFVWVKPIFYFTSHERSEYIQIPSI